MYGRKKLYGMLENDLYEKFIRTYSVEHVFSSFRARSIDVWWPYLIGSSSISILH